MLGTAGLGTLADWFGMPHDSAAIVWGTRWLAIGVTFVLDAPRVYHGSNQVLRFQFSQGMGRKPL